MLPIEYALVMKLDLAQLVICSGRSSTVEAFGTCQHIFCHLVYTPVLKAKGKFNDQGDNVRN
jgi:hypothetical protein